MHMSENDSSPKTFENALNCLEEAVKKLEDGSLPLESALETFEAGVKWSRECHRFLDNAEKRIEIILKNENGEMSPTPYEP